MNESASLVVATGAPDDHRQALQPGNGDLRAQAEIALAEQDAWSDEHHRGFWQTLLPLWPRRSGTVPVRQRLDALAGYLLVAVNWSPIAAREWARLRRTERELADLDRRLARVF